MKKYALLLSLVLMLFSVQGFFSLDVLAESATPPQPPAVAMENVEGEAAPETPSTASFTSVVSLLGTQTKFWPNEIFTIYNTISVNGHSTVVDEGAYTIVSIPKEHFNQPNTSSVAIEFDFFKDLEFSETPTHYQIKTIYKTLYGGYIGGTPIRLSLKNNLINDNFYDIKQTFYNKDDTPLTQESVLKVQARMLMESLHSYENYYEVSKEKLTENKIIQGNYILNPYLNYSTPTYNDIRERRLYVTLPQGVTLVDPNSAWTFDAETGRYYRDIKNLSNTSHGLTVSLDGVDLTGHEGYSNRKKFIFNYSLYVLKDGQLQTDLGPSHSSSTYGFYYELPKPSPSPSPSTPSESVASIYPRIAENNIIIGKNYERLERANSLRTHDNFMFIPYDEQLLGEKRLRYYNNHLVEYNVSNSKGDEAERSIIFNSAHIGLSQYVTPKRVRLRLNGVPADKVEEYKAKFADAKVYGIQNNNTKTLITENVNVVAFDSTKDSFNNDGWITIPNGENYSSIYFEYPNNEAKFVGTPPVNQIIAEVIADIKPELQTKLKNMLANGQAPVVGYNSTTGVDNITVMYKRLSTDTVQSNRTDNYSSSFNEAFAMNYEEIRQHQSVRLHNGSQFFVDNTLETSVAYEQSFVGDFTNLTEPRNLYVYYLVPDGLEPVANPKEFESIEVIRKYTGNYNLVIAKPFKVEIPVVDANASSGSRVNKFNLNFKPTERLEIGNYSIYSAVAYDNNEIGLDQDGNQHGILNFDSPAGVWANINRTARNRPQNTARFTNLGSTSFALHPPFVLVGVKQVKLENEVDDKYTSSLGKKASPGETITYRLQIKNNSIRAMDNLTIIDVLPFQGDKAIVANEEGAYPTRGSTFSTPLISVDDNPKFDIFYSTDTPLETAQDNNQNATWHTTVADMSKVTMVRAVLKTGETLNSKEHTAIILHTKLDNNPDIEDTSRAFNSFAFSNNQGRSFVETLKVEMEVNYPKRDVVVEKFDATTPTLKLANATFSLYDVKKNALVLENLTTNIKGQVTLPHLLIGRTYELLETKAPNGYDKLPNRIRFTVEEQENETDIQKVEVPNQKLLSFTIQKRWVGPTTHTQVTGKVLANDKPTGRTFSLTADGGWQTTLTGFPRHGADGTALVYSVEEDAVADFDNAVTGDVATGFTITNTNVQKRDISVTKAWKGAPSDSVTIELLADGTKVADQSITATENWQHTFTNQPKYNPTTGDEIAYTVQEQAQENYTSETTGDMENGFTITNTNTAKVNIQVTKAWIGRAGETATIELHADGTKKLEQTLTADTGWTHTFQDQPVYDATDGHEIQYTVAEPTVAGYTSAVTGSVAQGFTVTNTNTAKVNIQVTKAWIGRAGTQATIELHADGTKKLEQTLTAGTGWTYTFQDQPVYDATDGHEIQYTVAEPKVAGYTSAVTGSVAQGFTITNTNTQKVDIQVTKVWKGKPAESVTVELLADGRKVTEQTITATENWQHTFENQLKYNPTTGAEIAYTVQEQAQEGYTSTTTGDMVNGFTITNTNTQTVNIKVEKQWVGKPSESATIELHAGGKKTQEQVLTADTGWAHTFPILPQFDLTDGHFITYTIQEQAQEGYTSEVVGNVQQGFTVINTYVAKPDTVEIKAIHTLDGIPYSGEGFNFTLKDAQGNVVQTEQGEDGKIYFTSLTFNTEGTYTYTMVAEKGNRFDVKYDDSVYTLTITVEKPSDYVAVLTIDKDGKPYVGIPHFASITIKKQFPQTGDAQNVWAYLALSLCSLLAWMALRKRSLKHK